MTSGHVHRVCPSAATELLQSRGATDHKIHGSDRVTLLESRVGSFSDQQQQKRYQDKCDFK